MRSLPLKLRASAACVQRSELFGRHLRVSLRLPAHRQVAPLNHVVLAESVDSEKRLMYRVKKGVAANVAVQQMTGDDEGGSTRG